MAGTNLADLPPWADELLDGAPVARLGFVDDTGHPRVLPVTFAVTSGLIWSAIDDKPKRSPEPARIAYMKQDSRAALTVDHYSDDWDELAWVQALCETKIVEVDDEPDGRAALVAKYPQYRESSPGGPLIRMNALRCLWWRASGGTGQNA